MEDTTTPTQNTEAAEDSSSQVSSTSETTTSVEQPVETPTQEIEPAVESTPADPVVPESTPEVQPERQPRPAERRINELVQQNKQLREQLSTIPLPEQSPQAPKLSEMFQGKEQIQPDELDQAAQKVWQDGAQSARALTSLEVAQLRRELEMKDAINETDIVAKTLSSEYEELNPKSQKYNPLLEKKIVDDFQNRAVRNDLKTGVPTIDTSVKLADIARKEVEFYREATEQGKTHVSNTLASQVDEGAITPTSSTPVPDKSFDDMTLEEQEKYLRAQGRDI